MNKVRKLIQDLDEKCSKEIEISGKEENVRNENLNK
jgi:hypothetical protein